jgi:phenylpyruvate tautomerase PptA (4-oxalocrotonate tautomerase family)
MSMAQVKIYALRKTLEPRAEISNAIHASVMEALEYPADKKFHRFFPFEREDFMFSKDRSDKYTILEISMFEGRSVAAKKKLIELLYQNFEGLGIPRNDLEITIFETPKHNWGIRGVPGDELELSYRVEV